MNRYKNEENYYTNRGLSTLAKITIAVIIAGTSIPIMIYAYEEYRARVIIKEIAHEMDKAFSLNKNPEQRLKISSENKYKPKTTIVRKRIGKVCNKKKMYRNV